MGKGEFGGECAPMEPELTSQLEESVGLLTAQLEDARAQVGRGGYANRMPQGPISPKSMADLQAENAYLREENTELRRQVYMYTGEYGLRRDDMVKAEGYPQQYVPPPLTSPREGSSRVSLDRGQSC